MTVSEYQKKFVELSKYAQVLVADERDRFRRFEDGLREEIRTSLTSAEWTDLGKLVEAALRVEKSISERQIQRDQMKYRDSVGLDRAKVQDLVMVQYSSQLIAVLRVRALLRELLVQDRVRVLVVPDFPIASLVGDST
ncbi:CCHC-type domain-containing protein [Abeliophyllum distichum]|uniref:CCHC-type domain-containing protein n=1 Tax=Abeliophyllum distichum TaxID=126358 RepID=A0ABD1V6E3_9LAMI